MERPPVRRSDLPLPIRQKLEELEPRVQSNITAVLVWTRCFTERERAALGNDNYLAWKNNGRTAGMWAAVRECSKDRAILDIAYERDWIDTETYRQALAALGELTDPVNTPRWIARTGELWFDGQVVRKIHNLKKATNIVPILNAFEENGWPPSVDDPVTGGGDSVRRRHSVESLNDGLKKIRFSCVGDGESFRWDVVPARKQIASGKKKAAAKKTPRKKRS